MFKKGDIAVAGFLIVAVLVSAVAMFHFAAAGRTVVIRRDEEILYEGSLYENKEIQMEGNTAVIESGTVRMRWADCKNQICVRHPAISKKGETIICLPHRIVVEIR